MTLDSLVRYLTRVICAGICAGIYPIAAHAGDHAVPPGQWLLDHGRSHGLTISQPVVQDAEYVLIWMRAATEVSPDLCLAHLWQHDLLARLNRFDEAREALAAYCKCVPDDLPAVLNLIDIEFEACQTAEDRMACCEKWLAALNIDSENVASKKPARENATREVASDLHRRIAQLHLSKGDTQSAAEHARRALILLPQNLQALVLLAAAEGRMDDPVTRVSLALGELSVNPISVDHLWSLGQLCDTLSMPAQAATWYARAADAYRRQNPRADLPAELLLDSARAHLANRNEEQAALLCKRMLERQPGARVPSLVLIHATRRLGRHEVADRCATALDSAFRKLEDQAIQQSDGLLCAQIAWFHIREMLDPRRALKFAELADGFLPSHPNIARIRGWAYLATNRPDEAARLLAPLAETDQWAAVGLARAQLAVENRADAIETLRKAEKLRQAGMAYESLVELLGSINESPAPKPDRSHVAKMLNDFDVRLLGFHENMKDVIEFRVTLPPGGTPLGQPILAEFALTNVGPYTITLGADRMIDPNVVVSIRDATRKGAAHDSYLSIPLIRRHVLMPQESIRVERRLDTGAARLITARQPQRRIDLQFAFALDPVGDDSSSPAAIPAFEPIIARAARLPLDASPQGLATLVRELQHGTEAQRLAAVEGVGALILERNESLLVVPTYAAATVDARELTQWLLTALRDELPVVRARAVAALFPLSLGDEVISAAAPLLRDPSWVVRLAVVELFAGAQGAVFLPVLDQMVDDDHPLVAELATLFRDHFRASLPKEQAAP